MLTKILTVIFAFIVSLFCSIYNFFYTIPDVAAIKSCTGIKISSSQIEFYEDEHGSFHGDGEMLIIFSPTENQIDFIKNNWKKTPIKDSIAPLIFSKSEYNSLKDLIPDVKGFWIFEDRGNSAFSYNFSFAFFDGENVYYYELDT